MDEFRKAWEDFILTFAKELHLDKFLDWLNNKLK